MTTHIGKSQEISRELARQRRVAVMDSLRVVPDEGTKLIPLSNGKVAIVDEADYDYLNQWNWHCVNNYARRQFKRNSQRTVIWMHRLIAGTPDELFTDHVNGNTLDNRRSNLRVCNAMQNQGNRKKSKNGKTSRFKGVSKECDSQRYRATAWVNGKRTRLGGFDTQEEAACAYNMWAMNHFGEFSRLNQI